MKSLPIRASQRAFRPGHEAIASHPCPASAEPTGVGLQFVADSGAHYELGLRWRLLAWSGRHYMIAPGPWGVETWHRISRGRWVWLSIALAWHRLAANFKH